MDGAARVLRRDGPAASTPVDLPGGFRVACSTTGSGPLVVCLHGFPDSVHTWRHLAQELVRAGRRVAIPAMRGYHPTAVPADGGDYRLSRLAADVNDLHEMLGGDRDAVLVGHDWGAETAYQAASEAPERWAAVVAMSVPPAGLDQRLMADPDQRDRLAYAAELAGADDDLAVHLTSREQVEALWRRWSPDYDPTAELDALADAWPTRANRVAAVSYYRCNPIDPQELADDDSGPACPQPTLYLHGQDDGCIRSDLVRDVTDFLADGSEAHVVAGAGHFVHLEQPDVTSRLVSQFLARW